MYCINHAIIGSTTEPKMIQFNGYSLLVHFDSITFEISGILDTNETLQKIFIKIDYYRFILYGIMLKMSKICCKRWETIL